MAAHAAADPEAFEVLHARYGKRLLGYFLLHFRDRAKAEDLMQATFLRLHRARDAFDSSVDLGAPPGDGSGRRAVRARRGRDAAVRRRRHGRGRLLRGRRLPAGSALPVARGTFRDGSRIGARRPGAAPLFRPAATAFAVCATVLLWASAFSGIRAGLAGYAPAPLALSRFAVASLALLAYVLLRRVPLPQARDWPRVAFAGAVGIALYNVALNAGERTVPAGAASVLVNTVPVWTALLAAALGQESVRPRAWLGMFVAFSGAAAIAGVRDARLSLHPDALWVLAAAIAQAVYFVLLRPLAARSDPVGVTAGAIWCGTALLLPFATDLPARVADAPLHATLSAAYLGLFPGAAAYVAWSHVLGRLPAARAASFLFLVPVASFAIAWVWLGESPGPGTLAGAAVTLGGVVLVHRSRSAPRDASAPARG